MAQSFLTSDGDIKTVLRTMFDSPEFWAPEVYRAKVKTPVEFVVSAVRASGADVKNALPLVQALDKLGMPLYGMQTPNGYSLDGGAVGEHGRAGEPDELCAGAEQQPAAGMRTDWTDSGPSVGWVATVDGDGWRRRMRCDEGEEAGDRCCWASR